MRRISFLYANESLPDVLKKHVIFKKHVICLIAAEFSFISLQLTSQSAFKRVYPYWHYLQLQSRSDKLCHLSQTGA